jgi:hypothetical protein
MPQTFNIYCDESCHLENDRQKVMVLGAVWCPRDKAREIAVRLREIKENHDLAPDFEVKWSKISPAKKQFYMDILDYFFDCDDLHFRALIVPDKSKLDHSSFGQSHDDFYYKMYFDLLKVILSPNACYRIFIDIKDTHGAAKVAKLHDVLSNNMYDFSKEIIERVQLVRSHEIEQLQLTDLLTGIISYTNRGLNGNAGKEALVRRAMARSHYSLRRTTLLREEKLNLFSWHASEV